MKNNFFRFALGQNYTSNAYQFSGNVSRLLKTMLCLVLLLSAGSAFSQTTAFITTWKTNNPGTSNSTSITIPTTGSGYLYDADWNNDGIFEQTGITGSVTHNFVTAGTYTVRIRGNFPRIFFNDGGDGQKLLNVNQWGGIAWTSMLSAFWGCSNLNITATDVPNLSGVTSTANMFASCTSLNGPANIGTWNMATVTDMRSMFHTASAFNQPIGTWNTAAATLMSTVFFNATSFNQPIGTWNTAAMTTMAGMFSGASAFNQPLNTWTLNAAVNLTTMLNNCGMDCSNYSTTLIGWRNNPATPNSRSLGATGRKFETNAVAARTFLDVTKGWTISGDALVPTVFFADADGDGFGNAAASQNACSQPSGFVTNSTDCNDANAAIKPSAIEICNGIDDNCNGAIDEGFTCMVPFITTWKTDNLGFSNSTSIFIPGTGTGFNYEVDWNNDGIYEQTGITGSVTHDFGVAGTYTVRLRGDFPKISFSPGDDCKKLLDINQWGGIAWTEGRFFGCSNLNISATDVPNLSGVTDMRNMFRDCTILNGPANIGSWNTASVTNMGNMFENASSFNQPIGTWNTANVTLMNDMFIGASAFNQPIGSWNTAKVTNMSFMFFRANSFNQPIGTWNTASVTNMGNMFLNASSFNQPIGNWNTAKVTNMNSMLRDASSFNQPIGNWNTAAVTTMAGMFSGASSFNQPIGTWALNAAVDLANMLDNCGMNCTNYSATLVGWSNNPATPNARSLGASGRLFETNAVAARTNLDITKAWTIIGDGLVPTVFFADADGDGFGNAAVSINACSQPSGFVSNSTDCNDTNANVHPNAPEICNGIDDNCNGIIDDGFVCPDIFITTWKTNNTGTSNSSSITIPTTGSGYNYAVDWNNDGVFEETGITGSATHNFGTAGTYTIRIRGSFPRIFFNNGGDRQKLLGISQWGTGAWTSMSSAFFGCSNLNITATDVPNLSGVTDMSNMFKECSTLNGPSNIGTWNTANVTNMSGMFILARSFNQPIGSWNTANVTNMSSMFQVTHSFNQPIGTWNTEAVTTMANMFSGASSFNQPIGTWNTAATTSMFGMFSGAISFNQPIGTWNTAATTSMSGMFFQALAFNQPIGNWNTAAVTDMNQMFRSSAFNQPIGNWNTAKVTNMDAMFRSVSVFNQPIGTWNTAKVTSMSGMFNEASSFNQSIGTWTLNATVDLTGLLDNCGMNCTNYSATLIGWSNNPATPNARSMGASGRVFETNAVAARTNLDITKAWTIIGDALVPTVFFADADGDGFGNAVVSINACSQPSGFVSNSTDCNDTNANVHPNATEICNGIDDNCNGIIDEGCTPLAVEFTSITATAKGNLNVINFATATEKDVKEFAIERSIHNRTWEVIGTKAAIGGTSAAHYSFNNVHPMPLSYYRVRSIETSGKEQISKVVVVKRDGGKLVVNKVFPLPTTEGVTVDFSTSKISTLTIVIMDIVGKVVKTETFKTVEGANLLELNLSNLAQGAYILSLYDGETMVKQRIVKQ